MELNDFSSVLELLTGYNFVNAFSRNPEIKTLLNLSIPSKDVIEDLYPKIDALLERLKQEIKGYSLNPEQSAVNYVKVRELKSFAQLLKEKDFQHEVKVKNLYLIAGCLSFIMLIFSGFTNEYHKLNSIALTLASVLFLKFVFINCENPKKNNVLKTVLIVVFSLVALLSFAVRFFNNEMYHRHDQLWLISIIVCLFSLVMIWLRKNIVKRNLFKVIFILGFFIFPFIPVNQFAYDFYYNSTTQTFKVGCEIVSIVAIGLFPILYDLMFHRKLLPKVEQTYEEYKAIEILYRGGVNTSDKDLNPFKPLE